MKRPEYVAAAVTACRKALDGQQPDLDELRAVFSRSGFTDGYFTGQRTDMFGTRRKEDVTAANEVFAQLQQRYQKPRKIVDLNARFVLHENAPAVLTVTDGMLSVTVNGEIPQAARSRPTDLPILQKQFEKLGDTVYSAGSVTAELDDGLMLPASALNALRRDAAAAMDQARITQNTPAHSKGEIPALPQNTRENAAPQYRLQIRRMEQLAEIADYADELEFLLLPLHLAAQYAESPQPVPLRRVILLPPRFHCNEPEIMVRLQAARAAGYAHLGCQHIAEVQLGKELGFTLHGTFGLHITNAYAAEFWRTHGLADALCSPEAPRMPAQMLPLGVFGYGRLPLMLMRNCPIRAQVGCAKCTHLLTDRKGAAVYTDCTRCLEKPDYAELFNAVPVWQADKPAHGAAYVLLSMTDEPASRVREVLAAYLRGADGFTPPKYTRGLRLL